MGRYANTIHRAMRFAGEVAAETLWPTRCALCDAPGEVLCADCAYSLPFLDWWRACPQCGSAYGRVQCDLCNPVALARIGYETLPFAGCASATEFDAVTGRLVRIYKDHGERRLASKLATCMERIVSSEWRFDAVTYIPATKAAFRYRGFDHCELLARKLADLLDVECMCTLDRPVTRDQRALGGRERIANLRNGFRPLAAATSGASLLLVDDVLTTGSTLCAASEALLAAGTQKVFCVTFARV